LIIGGCIKSQIRQFYFIKYFSKQNIQIMSLTPGLIAKLPMTIMFK
jgi:hypothetical protein